MCIVSCSLARDWRADCVCCGVAVTVELYEHQVEQLKEFQTRFSLPDFGKTVRVMIDYAVRDGDQTAIFFSPQTTCACGSAH